MSTRKLTIIFIVSIIFAAIGYDIYAISRDGTEASISHIIIEWSYKYPIFTFLFGLLCGHLFWRVRGGDILRKIEDNTRK
jgi:hypothetical protein